MSEKKALSICGVFVAICLMATVPIWADSGEGAGNRYRTNAQQALESRQQSEPVQHRHQLRPGSRNGLIQTLQHVYYPGDTLEIRVTFPRSLAGVWLGEADGYLVIQMPTGDYLPPILLIATGAREGLEPLIPEAVPDVSTQMLTLPLDTGSLPEGSYQMALILTASEGDPMLVQDWYGGFQGFAAVTRFQFASEPGTVEDDLNADGEVDDDVDADGYSDGEGDTTTEEQTEQ